MTDSRIYILVPTRDYRKSLDDLIKSWQRTTGGRSQLVLGIDEDQEELYNTPKITESGVISLVIHRPRQTLVQKLNYMNGFVDSVSVKRKSARVIPAFPHIGVGFVGDDCYFKTIDWESRVYEQLERHKGFCYCNDWLKGEEIPNNVFIHSNIIAKLGFMCPPVLKHYYIDNYWKDLGILIHNIHYFKDEIIEHRHWSNKKTTKDALYGEAENSYLALDKEAFDAYREEGKLLADAKKLGA